MASATTHPSGGLVLIRFVLGTLVTLTGWDWAARNELDGGSIRSAVRSNLDELAGPLQFWGDKVLLYNPDGIAFLVSWSVLISGVCLFLGALTRPAGWLVAFLGLHLFLYGPAQHSPLACMLMVAGAGCAISRAGRRLGLDIGLDGTLPSWVTWVRGRSDFLT